jgi:hypothetical protein
MATRENDFTTLLRGVGFGVGTIRLAGSEDLQRWIRHVGQTIEVRFDGRRYSIFLVSTGILPRTDTDYDIAPSVDARRTFGLTGTQNLLAYGLRGFGELRTTYDPSRGRFFATRKVKRDTFVQIVLDAGVFVERLPRGQHVLLLQAFKPSDDTCFEALPPFAYLPEQGNAQTF